MKEKYSIGFDIGGTNIACGLLDGEYAIVRKMSRPFQPVGEERIADTLFGMAQELCAEVGVSLADVGAVGVCIPGSVDTARGIVIDAHNLDLHDSPFRSAVEKRFERRASLLNDADAAALAEVRLGALRGTENSMLVTIGTGIGVGIILGGRLFHGGRGFGVEGGHMQLDAHGEKCTCGISGCLEALCAATWLNKKARSLLGPAADAKMLINMVKSGNALCKKIWDEYTDNLASALAAYINILDPQAIALGGGVSGAGDFLIDSIRDKVDASSFFRVQTPIVIAGLGNDAGIVGACIHAVEA